MPHLTRESLNQGVVDGYLQPYSNAELGKFMHCGYALLN